MTSRSIAGTPEGSRPFHVPPIVTGLLLVTGVDYVFVETAKPTTKLGLGGNGRTFGVLALLMLLMACARPPERVFVPGEPFEHVVEVGTPQGVAASIRVGEWLTLQGRRSTGPWIAVERASLGPDGCWVAPPPPDEEPQVADNLNWTAEPAGKAEFNLGILNDHTRRVRFSAPGRYRLHAKSSTWCSPPVDSNELTVVVSE